MERELALAGKLQASFLPSELAAPAGWQIAAALKPARQTSGDFYDLITLPEGRLGLIVADVVDKGIGAALFMALSWILIRTYALEHPTQPELVLSTVNHRILAETQTDQFVTAFYGILDPATGTLTYCNGGHPPPFLVSPQTGHVSRSLSKTGIALGAIDSATWGQATVHLGPGDVLVLYSDGITDAENAQGAPFGHQRLKAAARANLGRSAQAIQDALLTEVDEFVGEALQFDDVALMVVVRDT
jgi:sigma-B regulation protein RsbU (phosphoserine phosphatase)